MNFSQNQQNLFADIKRELTIFNPVVVEPKFDLERGHFLQIDYSTDVRILILQTESGEWTLDLYKELEDGSRATDFPQISRTLVNVDRKTDPLATPTPTQVSDAFVSVFKSLISEQPALRNLYSEEVHFRFLNLVNNYQERRAPRIEQARLFAERREEDQKKRLMGETVFATILGLGMLSFVLTFISLL